VRLGPVARMFDALVGVSSLDGRYRTVPASVLLLEEPLTGHQVTLDGYALVEVCAGDREELYRKFAEAELLLPFSLAPLPHSA